MHCFIRVELLYSYYADLLGDVLILSIYAFCFLCFVSGYNVYKVNIVLIKQIDTLLILEKCSIMPRY